MKAIILAGGEGSRLRPLSLLTPKPMLPLFDRPLLEHLIDLLRCSGFTDICITVRYLSDQITDWFGDGQDFGVSIVYALETEPLGTAGSVKQCQSFIGEDDFLVISGDAALDLDLRTFWEHHRLHGGLATILLHPCANPLEFGLVMTDKDGCVSSFLEKPGIEDACSDLINTGIYAFSSAILTRIPSRTPFDFGSELFPLLLRDGVRIHTDQTDGYWNDIGSCSAYLQTCRDVIDGRLRLPLLKPETIRNRCYISPNASVSPSAHLLPYSVIAGHSIIGDECRVDGSILMNCELERDSYVSESILWQRALLKAGARILDGCVLADGVTVSEGSILPRGSILWPEKTVLNSQTGGEEKQTDPRPCFHADGSIRLGSIQYHVMDSAFRFGFCKTGVSKIALAFSGGTGAELFCSAVQNGCRLSGKECIRFDAEHPAAAAMLSRLFCFPLTFFVRQSGRELTVYAYGQDGAPIARKLQRILERADMDRLPVCYHPLPVRYFRETMSVYYRFICPSMDLSGFPVSVSPALKQAFLTFGAEIVPPADGVLSFGLSEDGFSAFAQDENGLDMAHTDLLVLWAFLTIQDGAAAVRVPLTASPVLERIAARYSCRILWGNALPYEDTVQIPTVTDGTSLLLSLSAYLLRHRQTLSVLRKTLPEYSHTEIVLETHGNTGMLLRELSAQYNGQSGNGLRLTKGKATATLTPLSRHHLRLRIESEKAELAAELCHELSTCLQQ